MTDSGTIRWGISGTGTIARQFAADIGRAANARLTAVAGRSAGKVEAVTGTHTGVAGFLSLEDMIASGSVDAVYVATSNTVHLGQTLACISARMPVLVEKPLTASLPEALEIRAAARSSASFVMEAMWTRYLPAVTAARNAIKTGAIGKVRRIEADIAWKAAYDPANRLFDKAQGGGALHDIGVYPLSLARFFLGAPDVVEGHWRAAPSGVDIGARVRLGHAEAEAAITCGFDRDGTNQFVVEGEDGVLVLGPLFINAGGFTICRSRAVADLAVPGGGGIQARIRRKLFRPIPLPGLAHHSHGFAGSGLQFEIEAASKAILSGLTEEPDNTLDDTIAVLETIDAILARPPEAGSA
ncbi:MAG: Gfo/Idh/MocA family oxidoreductase [Hoeflea sp.]|uniref:Gfo/Idh/MocA family protein n=1 Tax=Hoeflea sp. TaxID=1940281 RepID=UPI0032EE4A3C